MHINEDHLNNSFTTIGVGSTPIINDLNTGIQYLSIGSSTPMTIASGKTMISGISAFTTRNFDYQFDHDEITALVPFLKIIAADIKAIKENPALGKIYTGDDLVSAMTGTRSGDNMSEYEIAKALS